MAQDGKVAAGGDELLAAALAYAARGWPVFPLNGKVPRTPRGLHDASTNDTRINEWWRRLPRCWRRHCNWQTSGLLVLDVDPEHGGDDSLFTARAPSRRAADDDRGPDGRRRPPHLLCTSGERGPQHRWRSRRRTRHPRRRGLRRLSTLTTLE